MNLKSYKEVITKPLLDENPITLQILGICSALAVTNNLSVTMVMCVAVTSVIAFSNLFISLIRNYICLLYTSPSPRDRQKSRMPSSA